MAVAKFPFADWSRALRELCTNRPQGHDVWAPASGWVSRAFPTPDLGPPYLQAFADRQALWSRRLAVAYLAVVRHAELFREIDLLTPAEPWFQPVEGLCRALYEVYGEAEQTSPILNDCPLGEDLLALIITKAQTGPEAA